MSTTSDDYAAIVASLNDVRALFEIQQDYMPAQVTSELKDAPESHKSQTQENALRGKLDMLTSELQCERAKMAEKSEEIDFHVFRSESLQKKVDELKVRLKEANQSRLDDRRILHQLTERSRAAERTVLSLKQQIKDWECFYRSVSGVVEATVGDYLELCQNYSCLSKELLTHHSEKRIWEECRTWLTQATRESALNETMMKELEAQNTSLHEELQRLHLLSTSLIESHQISEEAIARSLQKSCEDLQALHSSIQQNEVLCSSQRLQTMPIKVVSKSCPIVCEEVTPALGIESGIAEQMSLLQTSLVERLPKALQSVAKACCEKLCSQETHQRTVTLEGDCAHLRDQLDLCRRAQQRLSADMDELQQYVVLLECKVSRSLPDVQTDSRCSACGEPADTRAISCVGCSRVYHHSCAVIPKKGPFLCAAHKN